MRRRNLAALKAGGQVLTGLRASLDRQIGSDFIWRVDHRPAKSARAAAGEEGPAEARSERSPGFSPREQGVPELPYHQFRRGESVLLAQTLASGDVPVTIQVRAAYIKGVVLEVRPAPAHAASHDAFGPERMGCWHRWRAGSL